MRYAVGTMNKKQAIPTIDVFAGPGDLGEGFSALGRPEGLPRLGLRLSIEKNPDAHRTLELRSFFRQFSHGRAPEDYYSLLKGEVSTAELYAKHPREVEAARSEAWLAEQLANGQKPSCTVMGTDAVITAMAPNGDLSVRMKTSGQLTVGWGQIGSAEGLSLARGMLRENNAADHALLAYHLFLNKIWSVRDQKPRMYRRASVWLR